MPTPRSNDALMVRRLNLEWADHRPFAARGGKSIRWLAVSDDPDPALGHASNRADLGPLDAIVGCGDLEPDYLGFLADAFCVPLYYVRGNHDKGGRWDDTAARNAPRALASGRLHLLDGVSVAALEWPGLRHGDRQRHDRSAWADALQVVGRRGLARLGGGARPLVVLSHAPPQGVGDRQADTYHAGYDGYRWLLERSDPRLWLHGHVPPASVEGWRVVHDGTDVVNVTGAVLVEIQPPGATSATTLSAA